MSAAHTDVVLLETNGLKNKIKIPTDHLNLFNTVLTELKKNTQGI